MPIAQGWLDKSMELENYDAAEKYQAIVEALENGDIGPFKAEVRSGSVGRGERAVGGFVCVRARMFGCVWT